MRFSRYFSVISTLVILILAAGSQSLLAQAARPAAPGNRSAPITKPNTPKQQPCWEQAGISKAAMEQRRSIQESTRAQIEEICADTSLTDKQKREKIREIRQAAQQKMSGLITPQEEEALKACQKSRGKNATPHPKGGGPCAQLGH